MKSLRPAVFFSVFAALGFASAVACSSCSNPSPPKPPVVVVSDAGLPPAEFPDDCAGACFYWRRADCSEGNPTLGGDSCEAVCRNLADAGIDGAKQLSCASTATDCTAIRACPF